MMAAETVEIPPDASRLTGSLQSIGYKFNWAIADLIDNSIDAGANAIQICISINDRMIIIADDGKGMTKNDLINAMRYGSNEKSDSDQLGKYGLGLKTASTSFSRKLTVISRVKNNDDILNSATWDLDHIDKVNKWQCLIGEAEENYRKILENYIGNLGTAIICEKINIGNDKNVIDNLMDHIGMVFARFLDSQDKRARNVEILINNRACKPWDPFCSNIEARRVLAEKTVAFPVNGQNAPLYTKAVLLPKRDNLNNNQKRLAKLDNKNQGFYIYRENRLIWAGGWLGLGAIEYHKSMLRVEVSINRLLDREVNINIGKSEVCLNDAIKSYLDEFIKQPIKTAQDQSREEEIKKNTAKEKVNEIAKDNGNSQDKSSDSKIDIDEKAEEDQKYIDDLKTESQLREEEDKIYIDKKLLVEVLEILNNAISDENIVDIKKNIEAIKIKVASFLEI